MGAAPESGIGDILPRTGLVFFGNRPAKCGVWTILLDSKREPPLYCPFPAFTVMIRISIWA